MSDLLRRTLGEQITIETVLGGGVWRAHADPNQLELAILNLAVNARDAMPNGGKLTLRPRMSISTKNMPPRQVEVVPGPVRHVRRNGQRMRNDAGREGQSIRPVLHDKGRRSWDRSRAFAGIWLHQAIARPREDLQRGWRRHDD